MIDPKSSCQSRTRLEELNIPLLYTTFPDGFTRDINGWSFPDAKEKATIDVELTDEESEELNKLGLKQRAEHISGKTYRLKRLRTLDIEIASDTTIEAMNGLKTRWDNGEFADVTSLKKEFAKLYRDTCTQRCPHCFNQEDDFYVSRIINGQKLMNWAETKKVLQQAKRLGLESVKFLGIGEIFNNPSLFEILDDLERERLIIAIFTKGAALGDDETAGKCGYKGITTAEDLVKRISEYKNVSILLGANSFDRAIQDKMVGCGKDGGVVDYTIKRDRALKLLVKYGFNNPVDGKRLALIAAPVTPQVSDETLEMYEWGMRRNIPVITIPTMVSGKGAEELEWLIGQFANNEMLIRKYDPSGNMDKNQRYVEWLVDFYTDIYTRAIEIGVTDIDNIKLEGLSGYAGAAKCQQAYNGMYIRLPGSAQECPGRCIGAEIQDDIRVQSLVTTWVASRNYSRSVDCRALCAVKMKNLTGSKVKVCDCCEVYESVGSMPVELETRVIQSLELSFIEALV